MLEIDRDFAQDGDQFKGFYDPFQTDSKIPRTKVDCRYFIEIDPEEFSHLKMKNLKTKKC